MTPTAHHRHSRVRSISITAATTLGLMLGVCSASAAGSLAAGSVGIRDVSGTSPAAAQAASHDPPRGEVASPDRATDDLLDYHRARIVEIQARIEAQGLHWTPGMTSLTAYTPEELEQMLGLRMPEEVLRRGNQAASLPCPVRRDLPAYFDWRDHDGMTPVKDQDGCGSCWDFAACGALEGSIKIHGAVELDLSEQQVLSCATPGWGCGGGWSTIAWEHFRSHGAVSEECMPYQADDSVPCTEEECELIAATREWLNIPANVDAVKTAVYEYGPVTTAFAVQEDFFYYEGGCYELEGDYNINHEMVIAGWDDEACDGGGAWLVKNSWSEGWGEDGYAWIKYGTCKIGTHCEQVLYYPAHDLEFLSAVVIDGARGDGDERLDPGETADLSITIRNALLADPRTGIAAQLSTASDLIAITQAQANAPDLQPGEAASLAPAFTVVASPYAAIGEEIEFELAFSAGGGYAHSETFTLQLGDIPLLLVDDDDGTLADPFFRGALDEGGYLYRIWDTQESDSLSASVLERHAAVLWLTGVSGRIDATEQAAIDAYLSGGGSLCASGQDIGWYMHDWGGATPDDQYFYENSLHAIYFADDSGFRHLEGVAGDPISDGVSFDIGGGDGSCMQDYPSWIGENAGSLPLLYYDPGVAGAVRYEGEYRMVYYAFGVEAINAAADRALLIARTLEYLVEDWPDIEQPVVTVTRPEAGEQWWPGSEVTIAWEATDNVGVTSVAIWLSRDGGATFPENLASGLPNEGSYLWVVGGDPSEECMIEVIVQDATGLMGHDYSEIFEILDEGTGVDDGIHAGDSQPLSWSFSIQPTPLLNGTWLHLTVPSASDVGVTLHDLSGRLISTLHQGPLDAGRYSYVWHGRDSAARRVPAGIYFARIADQGSELFRKRLLVLR